MAVAPGHRDGVPDGAPRVVVLRALGLGDLLTAVPALRGVRAAFPDHRLLLAAPEALAPLAIAASLADEVVPTDLRAGGGPAPLIALDHRLNGAEVAVNLHGAGPQSHRLLLATRPLRLVAYAVPGLLDEPGRPHWRQDEHEVLRWCRLLESSGIPADPARLDLHLDREAARHVEGATILHPGAAAPARRWPAQRWVEVARAEREAGRRVLVTGSPGERSLAERVAAAASLPSEAVLAGHTGVLDLAGVVAGAGRVVCGDTGVAHLATALGTPSVVLFGPVPPTRWGPPADRPQHRALWAGREGDPHGDALDPGLDAITVQDVLTALADLSAPTTATIAAGS